MPAAHVLFSNLAESWPKIAGEKCTMAPQEHSYRQPLAEPKHALHQTLFEQSSPEDYEVSGSEVDSDHQPVTSHLLRRSRSLTDAGLTDELQPSGRPRSFFSKRRLKPTHDQPALSATNPGRSFTTPGRSLGLLSSQTLVPEPDSKPPTSIKQAETKSVRAKGDSDSDGTASKPKSGRWWSWGSSSSKGMKPDSKVLLRQGARSPAGKDAGSNSRPSSLDLQGQPARTGGGTSSAALAQTSPLAQPGCMSMFTTGPGQPEKPVSQVQWTGKHLPCLLLPSIHLLLPCACYYEVMTGIHPTATLPSETIMQLTLPALQSCMAGIHSTKTKVLLCFCKGDTWLLYGDSLAVSTYCTDDTMLLQPPVQ